MQPEKGGQTPLAKAGRDFRTIFDAVDEVNRLREALLQNSAEINRLKAIIELAKEALPCVNEDRAARKILSGELSLAEGAQVKLNPGTHAHLQRIKEKICALNANTKELDSALKEIQEDYSLYEGAKRERIGRLAEGKQKLFQEIEAFVPAEIIRQKGEFQKGHLWNPSENRFSENGLASEWLTVKAEYERLTETVRHFEDVLPSLQSLRGISTQLVQLAKDLESCRLEKHGQIKGAQRLQESRTALMKSFEKLAQPYQKFLQQSKGQEYSVRKAVKLDFEGCNEQIYYTNDLLDVIEQDQMLTHVLEAIDWTCLAETKKQASTKPPSFEEGLDSFFALKGKYDAARTLIDKLSPSFKARIGFLQRYTSSSVQGRALLSEHAQKLQTLWGQTEAHLSNFHLALQDLAYHVGSELHSWTEIFEDSSRKSWILLQRFTEHVLPEPGEIQGLLANQGILIQRRATVDRLLDHLQSLGGLRIALCLGNTPKNSHAEFQVQTIAFHQALYNLLAINYLLSINQEFSRQVQELSSSQVSLIQRVGLFLRNAGTFSDQEAQQALQKQISAAAQSYLQLSPFFDSSLKIQKYMGKTKDELQIRIDPLAGSLVEHSTIWSVLDTTVRRLTNHLKTVSNNHQTLERFSHDLSSIPPTRKQGLP